MITGQPRENDRTNGSRTVREEQAENFLNSPQLALGVSADPSFAAFLAGSSPAWGSVRFAVCEAAKAGIRIVARDIREGAIDPRREQTIARQQRDRAGADVVDRIPAGRVHDRVEQRI